MILNIYENKGEELKNSINLLRLKNIIGLLPAQKRMEDNFEGSYLEIYSFPRILRSIPLAKIYPTTPLDPRWT